ncbi:MAG: S8 family serine peptidase, partial [Ignavibacteriaceae bacterium]
MNHFTLRRNNMWKIAVLFTLLITVTSIYAQHSELILSNGRHVKIDNSRGVIRTAVTKDGKIQSILKENPNEIVRLIVTFKAQPLSVYQSKGSLTQKISLTSVYASLLLDHTNFRSSLNTIKEQLSVQLKSEYDYKIMRDYYRVLNGVALECKRGMINRIKALPTVGNITPDKEVKLDLEESIHQIRADIVQDSLGYKGNGILVGDIDTGIDYNNPALGGGFGLGFRVIGGIDFANNDNDPMDDHGHGTHVAGIIGANGGDNLHGVAPEVKFLAVKVLNAEGVGYVSDIIAGIEYCLDPDNNPATNDGASIINLSLGMSAPYCILDSAVNNATKEGVLSVVAAGNNGISGYGTVGSPATSESALTVGACDSINQIASFSSRGPEPINSFVKPEVVAPGVNILSTVLNNKTSPWSGTSMAAPHVTGIAALLKQEHPEWSPEEIKAVIINSAHSVGEEISPFIQGKGIVDALDAATTSLVVEPGILSFRRVDLSVDIWTDTINITVKNFRNV